MAAERSAAGEALPAHLAAVPSGAATKHSHIAHGVWLRMDRWINKVYEELIKHLGIASDQDRLAKKGTSRPQ